MLQEAVPSSAHSGFGTPHVGVLHSIKCRFNYFSGTVRPTDQEIIAVEKIVCYSQFPRGGTQHGVVEGKHQGQSAEREREREGKMWIRVFIAVSAGWYRQGRIAGLGAAHLNHFSQFWGIEAAPSGQVPGSGMMRAGEPCKRLMKEVIRV